MTNYAARNKKAALEDDRIAEISLAAAVFAALLKAARTAPGNLTQKEGRGLSRYCGG